MYYFGNIFDNQKLILQSINQPMSSYITYSPNETVYVKDIGYGTLIECGKFKTISIKNETISAKKDSIIFDPDMFNSDGDSNKSKKSESLEKKQSSEVQENKQQVLKKRESKTIEKHVEKALEPAPQKEVNIVSVRLQSCKAMVYTSDINIKKNIDLIVKPILLSKMDQIVIAIDINKSMDSLKKIVFDRFGEQIGSYYNIRLFAVCQGLIQLNGSSKTVAQYGLKDCSKIVLEAKYAFSFCDIPAEFSESLTLSNGSNTLNRLKSKTIKMESSKKPSQTEKEKENNQKQMEEGKALEVVEANKEPEPEEANQMQPQAPQLQPNKDNSNEKNKEQEKKPETNLKPEHRSQLGKGQETISFLSLVYCPCKVEFSSGRHYWELKLDKGSDQGDIWIGFSPAKDKWQKKIQWAYLPLGGKKCVQGEWSEYGYRAKPGDNIGIFLSFKKSGRAHIAFYKNSVSCGWFATDLEGPLVPMLGLGGEAQITLDSRVQFPLDSYRGLS